MPWRELYSAPMGEARDSAFSPRATGSHFQMHLGTWVCLWGELEKESEENEMLAMESGTFCGGQKNGGRVGVMGSASHTTDLQQTLETPPMQPSPLTPNTVHPKRLPHLSKCHGRRLAASGLELVLLAHLVLPQNPPVAPHSSQSKS